MTRLWKQVLVYACLFNFNTANAEKMDLDEALRIFLSESPFIASESYQVDEARRMASAAFGQMLPSLNFRAEHTQLLTDPAPGEADRFQDYLLILRQVIFQGGSNYYDWRASQHLSEATKARVESIIQNLKLELIQIYLTVLAQQEILGYQQEQVRVLKNQLEVVRTRFEAGATILSDIRQAEARLAASEGATALAKSQLDSAYANLERFLGPASQGRRLSWPEHPSAIITSAEDLFLRATTSNPSLQAASFEIEQRRASKQAIRGQYLPQISAEVRVRERHADERRPQQQEFVLGMNMNLFDGLRTHHESARSNFALRRSVEDLEIVKRGLQRDSEEVISQHQAAQSNLNSLELAVRSAEEATRAFQIEYQTGSRSLSDLLNAEQDLLVSRIGLAQARLNYLLSAYRIRLVEGSL